jgi:hypothetical protein
MYGSVLWNRAPCDFSALLLILLWNTVEEL